MSNLARIRSAQVLTSGNVLCVTFEQTLSPNADANVTAVTSPPVLKVNGAARPAFTGLQWRIAYPYLWTPLNKGYFAILDSSAGAGSYDETGAGWTTYTADSFYLGATRYTGDPSSTTTFTFTGVVPGQYIISRPYMYGNSAYSTDVTFTVYDGATPVATLPVDMSVPNASDPTRPFSFHFQAQAARWCHVGRATVEGTTLRVTISNGSGLGLIVADAIHIERMMDGSNAICQPGDVLTMDLDDAVVTTTQGTVAGVTGMTVDFVDDATIFPFDPEAARPMGLGYGLYIPDPNTPYQYYANRARTASGWYQFGSTGTFAFDPTTYELSTLSGGAVALLDFVGGGYGPSAPRSGTWTVKYRTPGVPTLAIIDAGNNGASITGATSPTVDPISSKQVVTFGVTAPTPTTLDAHSYGYQEAYSLRVSGAIITEVEILGPDIPSDWTSDFHPSVFERYSGQTFLRFMDTTATNNSPDFHVSDLADPGKLTVALPNRTDFIGIAAIHPVDTTGADTDDIYKYVPDYNPTLCIIRVETTSPHGFTVGHPLTYRHVSGPSSWTGSNGGVVSFVRTQNNVTHVKDATNFYAIVDCTFVPGEPSTVKTVAGVNNPVAYFEQQYGRGMPIADVCRMANELGLDPWFNIHTLGDDAYIAAWGDIVATTLDLARKARFAFGNETWNVGFSAKAQEEITARNLTYWFGQDHDLNDTPPGENTNGRYYHGRKSAEMWVILEARFMAAGRPTSDVIRVMESQFGGPGYPTLESMRYCRDNGVRVDELSVADYVENHPLFSGYGSPDSGGGSAADPSTAYDNLDIDGLIDVLSLHIRYGWGPHLAQHRDVLNAMNTVDYSFDDVVITAYEGGDEYMCPFSADGDRANMRSGSVARHPRNRLAHLAKWQYRQADGWRLMAKYGADLTNLIDIVNYQAFFAYNTPAALGDGTDGQFDNRLGYHDKANLVAPVAMAQRQWLGLDVIAPATLYTIAAASSGTVGTSQVVTITLDAPGTVHVTLVAVGGTLSSTTVSFTGSAGPRTVTFTPTVAGIATITGTNDAGLTDPSQKSITISDAPVTRHHDRLDPGRHRRALSGFSVPVPASGITIITRGGGRL